MIGHLTLNGVKIEGNVCFELTVLICKGCSEKAGMESNC